MADDGVMDQEAIKARLPHRYPFLLIDRVISLEPGHRIEAIKSITANEPFFQGHFPDHPVMPGVLILEVLAQAGALLMLDQIEDPQSSVPLFAGVDRARFRRPVLPGDQLRAEVSLLRSRGSSCKLSGKAWVGEELAAEAEILAVLTPM